MFNKFATAVTRLAGSPAGFIVAVLLVVLWVITAEKITFNDIVTMITFLMVFVIQHTQNRDSVVYHLKQNEVIKAIDGARNEVAGIEKKSGEEIKKLENEIK